MEMDLCPSYMNSAAKITAMQVVPKAGKVHQPFDFSVSFNVINQTGMTDVALAILSPKGDGFPIEGDWESYSQAPGTYGQKVRFTYAFLSSTIFLSSCLLSPKPNQYDPFPPGTYTAVWFICEGTCGCTHSLCYTMDKQQTTFQITA